MAKTNVQDNIGMSVLKMFISKMAPFLPWTFSNLTTWSGDMGQKLHFYKHGLSR